VIRIKRVVTFIALGALLAAAGCGDDDEEPAANAGGGESGETQELEQATLRLDWSWQSYHHPFVYAVEKGYYEDEGIDLEIREGQGSGPGITLVGQGQDTFAFADAGTTMLQASKGVPVQVIGVIQRTAGFGIECFKDANVTEPADVEGKSVLLVPVESTATYWPVFLNKNGVPEDSVQMRNADFSNKVKLFADGQADCMAGIFGEDMLDAKLRNPDIADPIPWDEHGVQVFGKSLVASEDTISSNPELVEGFMRATLRAWEETCANPERSVKEYLADHPEISEADTEYVEQQFPLECAKLEPGPGDDGQPLGPTDDAVWASMQDALEQYGGLENPQELSTYYTNDFVTGAGG
jgi:NitT/TauT family transport system substrate-binding protein